MGGVCTSHRQELPFEPLQANSEAPTPVAPVRDANGDASPRLSTTLESELDSRKRSGSFAANDVPSNEKADQSSQTVGALSASWLMDPKLKFTVSV